MIDLVSIFQSTIEYKNFGANFLTVSAIATIIFSFVKGYGIAKQGIDIWKNESGESVSPIFFFYNFFYFLIFLTYGVERMSLAVMVNGSLCLLYLPILLGLKKYRGFSKKEISFITLMALVVPAIFLFDKSSVIFIFSAAAAVAIFVQAKEILLKKNFGNFSLYYLQTFLAAAIFWSVYHVVTKNWLLGGLNVLETILLIIALVLDKKWRKNRETKRPSD